MYQLVYARSVEKDLRKLTSKDLRKIVSKIQSLADQPQPHGAIKLRGTDSFYRVRQGDYRIIYCIIDETVTVTVIKIGHRRDIYDN